MVQFTFFDKNGGCVFKTFWVRDAYSEKELYYYLDNLCVMYDEVSAVSIRTDCYKKIFLREEVAEIAESCRAVLQMSMRRFMADLPSHLRRTR